jgi:DNA-binding LacI/PurR family transcriptional regulator
MVLLVGHMVSLGHRRICLAGIGGANSAYGARRRKGLDTAASLYGLSPTRAYVMMPARESISDYQLGRELAGAYLALGPKRPRAILALNDRIAFAMMSCLATEGLTAPHDYVIAGYDATELAELCNPALTTINPGHTELMQSACDLLFSAHPGRTKKIPPGLIVRASTQPISPGHF